MKETIFNLKKKISILKNPTNKHKTTNQTKPNQMKPNDQTRLTTKPNQFIPIIKHTTNERKGERHL